MEAGADVLLSAQSMDVEKIAKVSFTSPDRVRDVINNFNRAGFDSLYPRYASGRPRPVGAAHEPVSVAQGSVLGQHVEPEVGFGIAPD